MRFSALGILCRVGGVGWYVVVELGTGFTFGTPGVGFVTGGKPGGIPGGNTGGIPGGNTGGIPGKPGGNVGFGVGPGRPNTFLIGPTG